MRTFLLGVMLVPQLANATPCPFGVSPKTARRIFDQVKAARVGDGYRFDGMSTKDDVMLVQWSLEGTACPPIRIIVQGCTPLIGLPTAQLETPPELMARCPGLEIAVKELAGVLPSDTGGRGRSLPASALRTFAGIVGVIVAAGLLMRRPSTPTARTIGRGALGWIVFVLVGATPFLFDVAFAVTLSLGITWLVFAVFLVDGERERDESPVMRLSLLALFGFSLLLNYALSSGGPGDLRLNLAGLWSPELELRWGPSPTSLFRVLGFVLGDLRDTHIFWCNLILSSTLPLLFYAIVTDLGVGRMPALVAAGVAAAHPFLIAFSGVLERQATCRFAMFGAIAALVGFLRRGTARQLMAFVLGGVLAVTCRPEGSQVLIPAAAMVALVPATRRIRLAAAATVAVLLVLSFGYVQLLSSKFPRGNNPVSGLSPILWTVLFDGDFTPRAWMAAWIAGLVVGVRQRAAWVALISVLGMDLIWRWTGVYDMFVGHPRQIASARYESILLLPFVIGVALLIQAIMKTNRWVAVSALGMLLGCTALTFRRPFDTLLKPFTVDYEYAFLKKYALTLPPESRLYVLDTPIDDIGFLDASLVGQFVGTRIAFRAWSDRRCDEFMNDSSPAYLYVGSNCSPLRDSAARQLPSDYAAWMRDCAAIVDRLSGDPVETIDVPARKMAWHDFRDAIVRLALYRLKDPSICALGPIYPWRAEGARPSP